MTRFWFPFDLRAGSGPAVARLFHRLLALTFLIAWLSLGAQIDVLIGSRGLLPLAPFMAAVRARATFSELPTLFLYLPTSDRVLHAGIGLGIALSVAAMAGLAPRLCFGALTVLYLSFTIAGRGFLTFQWDNLLLECGLLAMLLPEGRRSPILHALFRILLFKLYWESGLAKWQSPLGDWQDGSAMTYYYETAPIPTRLAHFAHSLPEAWHHLESYFTLAFELALPLAIFGPRRARLAAAGIFTGFQLVNIATANYGFFAYLAIVLHVFLLDDRDVLRARGALSRKIPRLRRLFARLRLARAKMNAKMKMKWSNRFSPFRRVSAVAFAIAYGGASFIEALVHFGRSPDLTLGLASVRGLYTPFRVVNTYHLFAAITRERIEPELQTLSGEQWTAHDFVYKPGDPRRPPPFVAPHQPRVDFLLWFYGLSSRRGIPDYAGALLERVCSDPAAVASLFPAPLPEKPSAARFVFYRYHFTTPEQQRTTGAWWWREQVGVTRPLFCPGAGVVA